MTVLSQLSEEDTDMVLRAVRVGISGSKAINIRHMVSQEFPTPWEVFLLIQQIFSGMLFL